MGLSLSDCFGSGAKVDSRTLTIYLGSLGLTTAQADNPDPDQIVAAIIINVKNKIPEDAESDPEAGVIIRPTTKTLFTRGDNVSQVGYSFDTTIYTPDPTPELNARDVV